MLARLFSSIVFSILIVGGLSANAQATCYSPLVVGSQKQAAPDYFQDLDKILIYYWGPFPPAHQSQARASLQDATIKEQLESTVRSRFASCLKNSKGADDDRVQIVDSYKSSDLTSDTLLISVKWLLDDQEKPTMGAILVSYFRPAPKINLPTNNEAALEAFDRARAYAVSFSASDEAISKVVAKAIEGIRFY